MKKRNLIGWLAAIILISLFGLLIWNARRDKGHTHTHPGPQDTKGFLEQKIPGIVEYPELEEVFIDLYSQHGYINHGLTEEEIYFMQRGFEIYEEKTNKEDYSREDLIYLMSWETPKSVLEEKIPEIKNHPELEEVFIDLFAADAFSENETYHMKVGLEIYKEKPKLKEYPKEALIYVMSRAGIFEDFYNAEFFNQTLIPIAKEITAEAEDDLAAVKAISKWVNNNISYGGSMDYGPADIPEDVLEEKHGECGDYSVLIAGLARAVGIPARYVSVQLMNSGERRSSHAWVEVYIDGDWIPIASTGALDLDKDMLIEYSELMELENNKMLDVFIRSPYHPRHSRTDLTFGYNNYIIQQMIAEVESMLEGNYNLEAEANLESAKSELSLWETKKSTEDRNRIGREAMEHLLRAVAILEEDIKGDEVYVTFLEDFPIVNRRRLGGELTTSIWTNEVIDSAEINNPLVFWEDFQETLIETNPKVLYLFDTTYENKTEIMFAGNCLGIDLLMLQKINELITNESLDTEVNFVLYWSDREFLEKIEFLEDEDIEPVLSLTNLFQDTALDFMWDLNRAIESVKDNVTKTTFYLPPKFEETYNYRIGAMGSDIREMNFSRVQTGPYQVHIVTEKGEFRGWSLSFTMTVETSIGELPLRLEILGSGWHGFSTEMEGDVIKQVEIGDDFPKYNNLIIVDELGNVLRPDGKDGYYYSKCPGGDVNLDSGQNLIIEREGNYIKITETGNA